MQEIVNKVLQARNSVKQNVMFEGMIQPDWLVKISAKFHIAEYWESPTNVRTRCGMYFVPRVQSSDSVQVKAICCKCLRKVEAL